MDIIERDKAFRLIFLVALGIVIIGQIAGMVMHFEPDIKKILNTFMFCLIGIGYIARVLDQKSIEIRIFVILCGIFLIVMNFVPRTNVMYIFAGVALVVPGILFLSKAKKKEVEEVDSGKKKS